MYQIEVYPITQNLWRWEVRYGGALLCCGTAYTSRAAESQAKEAVNA